MNTAKEHYDQQLGAIYSWMIGNSESALQRNRDFFRQLDIENMAHGLAIDLGAGSGIQSIPLAELGFSVVAVDFHPGLLAELRENAGNLSVQTIEDDILNFAKHIDGRAQVVVCMGDTLTHLSSLDAVQTLFSEVSNALAQGGVLILTFRDYVSMELQGSQRFIPVRSDDSKILTCFLEYHEDTVEVHDVLYLKEVGQWTLRVSSYPKLRLDKNWISGELCVNGFTILRDELAGGMVSIVAKKS